MVRRTIGAGAVQWLGGNWSGSGAAVGGTIGVGVAQWFGGTIGVGVAHWLGGAILAGMAQWLGGQ